MSNDDQCATEEDRAAQEAEGDTGIGGIPRKTLRYLKWGCPAIVAIIIVMILVSSTVPPPYQYLSIVGITLLVRMRPYEQPLKRTKLFGVHAFRVILFLLRDALIFIAAYYVFLTCLAMLGFMAQHLEEMPQLVWSIFNFVFMFLAVGLLFSVREGMLDKTIEEEFSKSPDEFVEQFDTKQVAVWGRTGSTPFSRGTARLVASMPSAMMSLSLAMNLVLFAYLSRQSDLQSDVNVAGGLASLFEYGAFYMHNSYDALTLGLIDSYDLFPVENPLLSISAKTTGLIAKYAIAGLVGLYIAVLAIQVKRRALLDEIRKTASTEASGSPDVMDGENETPESKAAALLRQAMDKQAAGAHDEARCHFNAVLEVEGVPAEYTVSAIFNRGLNETMVGDMEAAATDFDAVIGMADAGRDYRVVALANLALIKRRAGDIEGAIADCTAAINMSDVPGSLKARAYHGRGNAYLDTGEYQAAQEDFDAILRLDDAPEGLSASALLNRGIAKSNLGNDEAALADFEAVLESDAASPELKEKARGNCESLRNK